MKQVKKIAIVLHGLEAKTGAEVLFTNLSGLIDPRHVSLTFLIAVDPDDPQFFEEKVKRNGAQVIHLHDLDKGRLMRWPWTLYRAFRKYGPFDGVHANMDLQSGVILAVAHFAGITLRICHAHVSAHVRDNTSILRRIYRRFARRLIHRHATVRLSCSETAGAYFYVNDPFTILDNGIDLNRFKMVRTAKSGNEKHHLRFITVGRLAPAKNPFFLLDVFEAVHKEDQNARLTWVGSGYLLDEVKESVRIKGLSNSVQFLEQRDDIPELMNDADCFLFPSKFEALGLSLLEAQAAGLICYVSNSVPKEADCGLCRFLSLDLTAEEWAQVILHDHDSDNKLHLNYARLEKYDICCMAERLTSLYLTGIPEKTDVDNLPSKERSV